MDRLHRIYENDTYQRLLNRLKELEDGRIFCRHDEAHFLAVARIAWIKCLEQGLNVEKERIYAAALLHDIGKSDQYLRQIPHEEASARYGEEILLREGFSREETDWICRLIRSHRKGPETPEGEHLAESVFYLADKASRNCFCCPAREDCSWDPQKKNLQIRD